MTRVKYKTIDLRTEKGFKQAERLKARGWVIGSVGFHTVQLYKREGRGNEKTSLINKR